MSGYDWEAHDAQMKAEAARARETRRRHDAALLAVLQQLRHWMPGHAYRADEHDPDIWHSACPACMAADALVIRQTPSGSVQLRCTAHSCRDGVIRARLQARATECSACAASAAHADAWKAETLTWREMTVQAVDVIHRLSPPARALEVAA